MKSTHLIRLKSKTTGENEFDVDAIDTFVPVAVSFDQMAAEGICWNILRDAGFTPDDVTPAITLSFWDLETICEVLDHELTLLHYFVRRHQLEVSCRYFGDESDLLVTYLETGFAVPVNGDESILHLMDAGSQLHPYFMSREHGLSTEKPTRRMHEWWMSMANLVARDDGRIRRHAAFALLDVPYETQLQRVRDFAELSKQSPGESPRFLPIESGSPKDRYAVVFLPMHGPDEEEGMSAILEVMQDCAGHVLSEHPDEFDFVFVFAIRTGFPDEPYRCFAACHGREDQTGH